MYVFLWLLWVETHWLLSLQRRCKILLYCLSLVVMKKEKKFKIDNSGKKTNITQRKSLTSHQTSGKDRAALKQEQTCREQSCTQSCTQSAVSSGRSALSVKIIDDLPLWCFQKNKIWPLACFDIQPPDLKVLLLRVWAAALLWGLLSYLWPFSLSPTWLSCSFLI